MIDLHRRKGVTPFPMLNPIDSGVSASAGCRAEADPTL